VFWGLAERAQLSEAARSIIRQTGNEEHCPVCNTPHSPDELLRKLEKLVDSPDTAALSRAEQTLGLAREQVRAAQANLNALTAMSSLASALQISSLLTAGEVLARIKQEQRELDDQVLLLAELESYFSNFDSDLSWRAWAAARSVAAQNCPPDVDLDRLESVSRAADAAARSSSDCEDRLESHRVTLARLYDQAFALTKRYVPALEGTFDELIEAIRQAKTQVEQGLVTLEEVGKQLVLDPEVQLDVLRVKVEEVSLAYERAVSACNAEAESQRSIKEAEEQLAQATTKISAAESQSANLKRVQGVLAPMLKQYSVEAATAEAFAGIRDAISATFALIHAPREYELGALNGPEGPFLKKIEDGAVHTFQQVSTGQRAALALSIFLASHESACSRRQRSAPAAGSA
jgi:chromosome segregation protein